MPGLPPSPRLASHSTKALPDPSPPMDIHPQEPEPLTRCSLG